MVLPEELAMQEADETEEDEMHIYEQLVNIVKQLNASIQAEESGIETEKSKEIQKCNACKKTSRILRGASAASF